jgi:4-diphosphocytidyl-2-C-methyl-D-erythritol kinase
VGLRALYDLPAPAKLNLFLHVVGRRPDGYHLLQSVFTLIDWADTLHLECRDDGNLVRHDLEAGLPELDLCLRAARALQVASGTGLGADIHIAKRIPWGAGMGGGSSDAATTLLGLNRLWGLGWPRCRLMALGLDLGADVPFFLRGRNAFVEGIGEKITPLHLPAADYAVLKPAASIATAAIFSHPALRRDTPPVILEGYFEEAGRSDLSGSVPQAWWGYGRNDLQAPAEDRCAEVAQAARWLEARHGNSRMTGSGSAVFAKSDAAGLPLGPFSTADLPPGWVGRMCRGLSRHPLEDWSG